MPQETVLRKEQILKDHAAKQSDKLRGKTRLHQHEELAPSIPFPQSTNE